MPKRLPGGTGGRETPGVAPRRPRVAALSLRGRGGGRRLAGREGLMDGPWQPLQPPCWGSGALALPGWVRLRARGAPDS